MRTSRTPRRTGAGTGAGADGEAAAVRRWSMLGASTLAQAAAAVMVHGPAFLIPALHDREGLSLAGAGLVAAAPTVGVMLTLVAWGAVDRPARRALRAGDRPRRPPPPRGCSPRWCGGTVPLALALLLAGAAAASTNAASGRVVVGWFPPERRGLAMGIRQMAQPVGRRASPR